MCDVLVKSTEYTESVGTLRVWESKSLILVNATKGQTKLSKMLK